MLDAVSLAVHQAPAQISMLVRNIVLKLQQPVLTCGPSLLQLHMQLGLDQFTEVAAAQRRRQKAVTCCQTHVPPLQGAVTGLWQCWTGCQHDWLPAAAKQGIMCCKGQASHYVLPYVGAEQSSICCPM